MQVGTREFKITQVRRHEDGYWTARVGGVDHDRKFGSWQVVVKLPGKDDQRREALPVVAAALQDKVKRLERGERLTGNETVSWPTNEHARRFVRKGEPIGTTAAPMPKTTPSVDPSMGPAEMVMARKQREREGE